MPSLESLTRKSPQKVAKGVVPLASAGAHTDRCRCGLAHTFGVLSCFIFNFNTDSDSDLDTVSGSDWRTTDPQLVGRPTKPKPTHAAAGGMELGRASAIVCLNLINFLSKSVVNILYSVFYICASVHLQTQVRMLVESVCNGTRVGVCQHANLCDAVFSVSFWQWWSDLDSEPDIPIYMYLYTKVYI